MSRKIGIDLGTKRVGFAVSDEMGMIASPLRTATVRNEWQALTEVEKVANEIGTDFLVLGLARDMSGKIGAKAKECQNFAEKLREKGYTVILWDERLTSVAAERSLIDADVSRKKRKGKIDAIAAQMILQGYLASN